MKSIKNPSNKVKSIFRAHYSAVSDASFEELYDGKKEIESLIRKYEKGSLDDRGERIYHEISVAFGMNLDAQEDMAALAKLIL